MYRFALVVVLVVVLAVSLTSCTESVDPGAEVAPVDDAGAIPEPAEETDPAADVAETEPAAAMDADAVVEEAGAPLYEGATSQSVETVDGATVATFTTPAAYKDVKEFYLAELQAPDWNNNGFEMGAMGGDEWEFTSADGTKLVMVKRDSDESETTIRVTLKPAE